MSPNDDTAETVEPARPSFRPPAPQRIGPKAEPVTTWRGEDLRLAGSLKDSTCRERRLVVAAAALPQVGAADRPCTTVPAPRALEAIRPAQLPQVCSARLLGREALLKLQKCPWVVLFALRPPPVHAGVLQLAVT